MGFRLLSVKPISKKEAFIPLKKWMVAGSGKNLSADGIRDVEVNATRYAKEYLSWYSSLTNFDYANACLLDEQYGRAMELEEQRLSASKAFFESSREY
tara:strand:+ start:413 stop:706 length:294 start_codon:yes stop_codon:yes gene_type:complete